ncbi:hypothetical protein BZG36_01087 [Bifiguratus adelaidae]|uniref:Transcription factor CBF/NF-Y/archaeal histone domain-containing protein n=1 Tax=Bifiguratus adelaidae TaxID=1938954 RepID=A0A261Y665_9FUNG|nr:hypothetical protein BZG36_01087 [Bifiguratus adelaidae]
MPRLYPRSTLKRIIKAHRPSSSLSKNADILIYLDYISFLEHLAGEAQAYAMEQGDKDFEAKHIQHVTEGMMTRDRGKIDVPFVVKTAQGMRDGYRSAI